MNFQSFIVFMFSISIFSSLVGIFRAWYTLNTLRGARSRFASKINDLIKALAYTNLLALILPVAVLTSTVFLTFMSHFETRFMTVVIYTLFTVVSSGILIRKSQKVDRMINEYRSQIAADQLIEDSTPGQNDEGTDKGLPSRSTDHR